MTGAEVALVVLELVGVLLRRLPLKEQVAARKALREAFVEKELKGLDGYARSKKR